MTRIDSIVFLNKLMVTKKKIAIITPQSFGYIEHIVEKLNSSSNVDLVYININTIPFFYKSKLSRAKNFFLKLFLFPSLKKRNVTDFIKKSIKDKKLDQVLIIRPDKLEVEALKFLRKNALQLTCYLFDGIDNFKRQKNTLYYFNIIYSYDRDNAEKYGFEFITNYIYDDKIESQQIEHTVFNISSYDHRFAFLEKLADYLCKINVTFRFIVKKEKAYQHKKIEFSQEYISLNKVKEMISQSLILVDIQKKNQSGLSFRVFEALGYRKKLITNNKDIVNYDFYDDKNIFIISEENYQIPPSFFETDYIEIAQEILDKYKLKNWIFQVFKIDCN